MKSIVRMMVETVLAGMSILLGAFFLFTLVVFSGYMSPGEPVATCLLFAVGFGVPAVGVLALTRAYPLWTAIAFAAGGALGGALFELALRTSQYLPLAALRLAARLLAPLATGFVVGTTIFRATTKRLGGGEMPIKPICGSCGTPYDPFDYRPDADNIYCSHCHAALPKDFR